MNATALAHHPDAIQELIDADREFDAAQAAYSEAYPQNSHSTVGRIVPHYCPIVIRLRRAGERRRAALLSMGAVPHE